MQSGNSAATFFGRGGESEKYIYAIRMAQSHSSERHYSF